MKPIVLVALGGALGSVLRFGISQIIVVSWKTFPWQTFLINLLGSLLIGILLGVIEDCKGSTDVFMYFGMIGFCGGFTTFSTFSKESIQLLQQQQYVTVIIYVLLSAIVGLALTAIGYYWAK